MAIVAESVKQLGLTRTPRRDSILKRYLLIGIMMCAPGVPGSISHGTP